jgi:acyl-CoA synthetase (AMP-forming)/AMP-acid ligase II
MPELDYLLDDSIDTGPFLYNKSFEQAKHHPCMVIHTSGSTGMPKPVIWTHWQFATMDAQRLVPDLDGRPTLAGKIHDSCTRCFSGLPIFHGAGIILSLMVPLYNGCTVVLGPPGVTTADAFAQVADHGRIDAASLLPVTLEDIASSPVALAKLQQLKFVIYTGGKLTFWSEYVADTDVLQARSRSERVILSQDTHTYSPPSVVQKRAP